MQEIVGENSAADLKPEEEKADADQLIDTNRTDPMSQGEVLKIKVLKSSFLHKHSK